MYNIVYYELKPADKNKNTKNSFGYQIPMCCVSGE